MKAVHKLPLYGIEYNSSIYANKFDMPQGFNHIDKIKK